MSSSYNERVQYLKRRSSTVYLSAMLYGSLLTACLGFAQDALAAGANADATIENGRQLIRQKAYHQAVAVLKQAVATTGEDPRAHLELARALLLISDDKQALLEYLAAITLSAGNTDVVIKARSELAEMFMRQHNWDEAGGQLKQLVDLKPQDLAVRGNYAICLEQLGLLDAAIEQFRIIAQTDSKSQVCHYNLAGALLAKRDFQQAAKEFQTVLSLNPKSSMAYTGLARCYLEMNDSKSAIALASRAVELWSENHWAHIALGDALDRAGRKGDAIESYRRAIQINPKDPACQAVLSNLLKQKVASTPASIKFTR